MTLTEAVSSSKKPTLLELQQQTEEQKRTISQLEAENAALRSEIQKAQLARDEIQRALEAKSHEEDNSSPEPIKFPLRKTIFAYAQKPYIPFIAAAAESITAFLVCPSLRSDASRLYESTVALLQYLNASVASITANTPNPAAYTMWAVTAILAVLCILTICLMTFYIRQLQKHYAVPVKVIIATAPIFLLFSDYLHRITSDLNVLLLIVSSEIILSCFCLFKRKENGYFGR